MLGDKEKPAIVTSVTCGNCGRVEQIAPTEIINFIRAGRELGWRYYNGSDWRRACWLCPACKHLH